jgi:DNA-cytosine methyltransferase
MLDLFSGIGGISLAAEWAGIETIAFCEIESFCQKVLRKHWPDVPIFEDVKKLNKQALTDAGVIGNGRTIDIVAGGYPCQPFSHAGKRKGQADDRHLWPEMFRLVRELRPTWVIGENVAGHVTLGLDDVLTDLESEGYQTRAFVLPAAAVGAPHRRDRVFVVAHASSKGLQERRQSGFTPTNQETRTGVEPESERCGENMAHSYQQHDDHRRCTASEVCRKRKAEAVLPGSKQSMADPKSGIWRTSGDKRPESFDGSCANVAHTKCIGQSGQRESIEPLHSEEDRRGQASQSVYVCIREERSIKPGMGGVLDGLSNWLDRHQWPAGLGQEQYEWEPPRVATGVKDRVGRLKALGNAVVPQQIYPIFAAIREVERMMA